MVSNPRVSSFIGKRRRIMPIGVGFVVLGTILAVGGSGATTAGALGDLDGKGVESIGADTTPVSVQVSAAATQNTVPPRSCMFMPFIRGSACR